MVNKIKYPVEAFALAMVLFSSQMKDAMLVGIALIFGDVLLSVLRENIGDKKIISGLTALLTCGALSLSFYMTGASFTVKMIASFLALGVLVAKHVFDVDDEIDYNEQLFNDSIAYGAFVLFALVRELLSASTIFEQELVELPFGSLSFAKPMFALIGAGIVIAIINKLLKSNSKDFSALWVCIPTIALEVPFIWNKANETIGSIIGILMVLVMYVTFRQKLLFSNTSKARENIPVEMVLLGMIYMIVTIF